VCHAVNITKLKIKYKQRKREKSSFAKAYFPSRRSVGGAAGKEGGNARAFICKSIQERHLHYTLTKAPQRKTYFLAQNDEKKESFLIGTLNYGRGGMDGKF
jgi:hypothetical protein